MYHCVPACLSLFSGQHMVESICGTRSFGLGSLWEVR